MNTFLTVLIVYTVSSYIIMYWLLKGAPGMAWMVLPFSPVLFPLVVFRMLAR